MTQYCFLVILIVKYFTVKKEGNRLIGTIPEPAKERLLQILRILEAADSNYTSAELEILTGWPSNTIRKDISWLGRLALPEAEREQSENDELSGRFSAGSTSGYASRRLVPLIKEALGLNRRRKFCVVGLGRLGSAYLNLDSGTLGEFELAAGFDINVNRVEILKSPVPLYPAHKIGEVIQRFGIEIALLCVSAEAAQTAAEKLAAAGIRGILNFAPVILTLTSSTAKSVTVQNVYVADELRTLKVKIGND